MWIRDLAGRDFANGPPSRDEIDKIISRAKCSTDDVLARKLDLMELQLGVSYRAREPDLLDWHQVQKMKETGLIEFGSHSRHHVRLSGSVNEQTILDEVQGSKYIIEQKLGCTVKTFCYPNGDMTPAAVEAVRHNYIGACTTASGWNSRHSDPHILKRIGIHQDIASNERAFLARLSGWL
jgi:peptidoglycan/xylan/chitin deacetylase (PgdA/CDA1 family)